MSLYTFAEANFTTPDDRKRRPAVSQGQVLRTLALCLVVALALGLMARGTHAAGNDAAPRAPDIVTAR